MENIRKYTYMSEEQFLNQMELDERCPFEFELKSLSGCNEGKYPFECRLCWGNAITDIQFNDPLVTFEKNTEKLMNDLYNLEMQIRSILEGKKNLKMNIAQLMNLYGVKEFENGKMRLVNMGETIIFEVK